MLVCTIEPARKCLLRAYRRRPNSCEENVVGSESVSSKRAHARVARLLLNVHHNDIALVQDLATVSPMRPSTKIATGSRPQLLLCCYIMEGCTLTVHASLFVATFLHCTQRHMNMPASVYPCAGTERVHGHTAQCRTPDPFPHSHLHPQHAPA